MGIRVAFAGASGTGKTTLARHLELAKDLPFNPVGSRSVAKAMGFGNPYDVDKAGKRAEFQRRLVTEKRAWEDDHEDFVSDRTTLDNLAYTMFHDVYAIDRELLGAVVEGMKRYTHIFFCPVSAFIDRGGDEHRVDNDAYHELYDVTIKALLDRYQSRETQLIILGTDDLELRKRQVESTLR